MTTPLSQFLESTPPGAPEIVALGVYIHATMPHPTAQHPEVSFPRIRLHCASDDCGGDRFFDTKDTVTLSSIYSQRRNWSCFITYWCRDCGKNSKTYSLMIQYEGDRTFALLKVGEVPNFGPPTPPRAASLIGEDRELFFKGRKCENQGLGVGAFAYYRRVIERQKSRIIDEFIRVLRAVSPGDPIIEDLERASRETQFSKSMDAIKHALPSSLSIRGQNPLALLHTALSEGLHALDDDSCLEYAQAIRTILFETAERLTTAMKDDAEVSKAIKLLAKAGSKQQSKQRAPTPQADPEPAGTQVQPDSGTGD